MKSINILPSKYRYDYRKHYLSKVLTYFFILNIIMLGVLYAGQIMYLNSLKKQIGSETNYYNQIKNLNTKFVVYNNQLNSYKNKLTELKEKEKAFLKYFNQDYSPYVSTLVLFNSLKKDIKIENILYKDGQFDIKGKAKNEEIFYRFYKDLEKNPYLAGLSFQELDNGEDENKKNIGNPYSFEIKLVVKTLNDIY